MPIKTLLANHGYSELVLEKIEEEGDIFYGYDFKRQQLCDMIDAGIYDSYNVVKTVLEDSVSLASMVLTTECILVKEKSYKPLPLQHYQERREFF